MGKDPAFLFYPGDWLGGTMTMNRHTKGCYIDLLMAQFNSGPLSLETIKTILGNDFAAWGVLSKKFVQTKDGLFFNERLDSEKAKRAGFCESRRGNRDGKKKKKTYDKTYDNTSEKHMLLHMENENRNEIIDYLNKKASTKFKASSEKTKKLISARFSEGYKVEDFKKVIDTKCEKWLKDPKMADFVRPETLFGTKFESYLNEKNGATTEKNITNSHPVDKHGYTMF